MAERKFLDYDGLQEYDGLLKQEIAAGDEAVKTALTNGTITVSHAETAETAKTADSVAWEKVTNKPSAYTPAAHNHDDKYYTETEIDAKFNVVNGSITNIANGNTKVQKATNADSAIKATQDADGNVITATYETKSDASKHNTSDTAHNDIRELISELSTKVNDFLDVDVDTADQLSEILVMINENKGTLESITSNKVNVSDIVDNLTTTEVDKVLSANQGAVLKKFIDELQEALDDHTKDSIVHITAEERTAWNKAEKNQNAFSNIKVGTATIAAATATDTFGLAAGENVTIIPDTTNKTITISATDTVTVVDAALNTDSTNPVQNKVINSAIVSLTDTIGENTKSIYAHSIAITNLQGAVDELKEITSAEITALFQ